MSESFDGEPFRTVATVVSAAVAATALCTNVFNTIRENRRQELKDQFDADFREPLHESFGVLKEEIGKALNPIERMASSSPTQLHTLTADFNAARLSSVNAMARRIDKMIGAVGRIYGRLLKVRYEWTNEIDRHGRGREVPREIQVYKAYEEMLEGDYDDLMDGLSAISAAISGNAGPQVLELCGGINELVFDYEARSRDYLNELRSVITTGDLRSRLLP